MIGLQDLSRKCNLLETKSREASKPRRQKEYKNRIQKKIEQSKKADDRETGNYSRR